MKHYTKLLLFIVCAGLTYPSTVLAKTWSDIRDGVIYIRKDTSEQADLLLKLRWSNVWISKSQEDHIYLQAPDGSLIKKLNLNSENTPGNITFNLKTQGVYRLEITGMSFRNVTVSTQQNVPLVLEPVKVHKSISLPPSGRLYFNVPKKQRFTFSGKRHGPLSTISIRSLSTKKHYTLALKKHPVHWLYDSISIPAQATDDTYEITWNKHGKVSFWLDSIPNLFSLQPEDLFQPSLETGSAEIDVSQNIIGTAPAIGVSLPFAYPPKHSWPAMELWNIQSANYYFFADDLTTFPNRDLKYLDLYQNNFNISHSNSILANSGRDSLIKPTKQTKQLLANYFKSRHQQGLLLDNYLALSDEPNLHYRSYDQFEQLFSSLASFIKEHPDPMISNTKLAVPQSSRFLQGPIRNGANGNQGILWADQLITKYAKWIDAISWHEWFVMDLIDTNRYRDAVIQADKLMMKHSDSFLHSPALIIGQTNIAGGSSLSPYEQDTFFTALWWTSVVIQSSLPGKLDQIMWFKAADDPIYKKGLIRVGANDYEHKPVSYAMAFINQHIYPLVVAQKNDHPDIDILTTLSEDRQTSSILGVNKSKRDILIDITLPVDSYITQTHAMNSDGKTNISIRQTTKRQLEGLIPQGTIFAITLSLQPRIAD